MLTAGRVGRVPQAPAAPTLVFDGSCGFCRKWVSLAKRLDRRSVVRLLPFQEEEAPVVTGRPREALERAAHFVRPDGEVFAGAAAAREFFRYVPGGWAVLGVARIPGVMSVAEWLYRWIARRWGPAELNGAR